MKKIICVAFLFFTHFSLKSEVNECDLHHYMMANFYQCNGKMKAAYQLYSHLINQNAPQYVYNGYVHLLNDTQNYQHIIQLIPKLDELFDKDSAIQLICAQVLERTGDHTKADERYIRLNDAFKSNQEIAFSTANSYLRRKEPNNALMVIDNLLNSSPPRPNNFIFHFMKSQICLQLNDKKQALEHVKKSLELHPRFDKGLLLFALLQEQSGELEQAIKGYTSFLEVTPGTNKDVEQHLLQLVFKRKIQIQNNGAPGNSLLMNKSCFDKALALFEEKKYDQALVQIELCLKEKPDDNESKLLEIQILSKLNKSDKIIQLVTQWILANAKNDMWYKTLHLLVQNTLSIEQGITILKNVQKKDPHNILPILYLADLTTRSQQNDAALMYLEKAFSLSNNDALKAKILYQIGVIHYDSRNYKELKKLAHRTHILKTSFAPLLNLIAYYYASVENELKRAQTLITQVLKQDAHNPHFLDTQALIYYKDKKYKKALPILKKIAQMVPTDYTIIVHLAYTHYESGDIDHALVALDQAKKQAQREEDKLECEQLLNKWKQKKS